MAFAAGSRRPAGAHSRVNTRLAISAASISRLGLVAIGLLDLD
jgi:hypothetical protein